MGGTVVPETGVGCFSLVAEQAREPGGLPTWTDFFLGELVSSTGEERAHFPLVVPGAARAVVQRVFI